MNTLRRIFLTVGTLTLTMLASACGHLSQCERNTAVGAALGGVAGSVVTRGSAIGAVGGAVAGGVIGNRVGHGC